MHVKRRIMKHPYTALGGFNKSKKTKQFPNPTTMITTIKIYTSE